MSKHEFQELKLSRQEELEVFKQGLKNYSDERLAELLTIWMQELSAAQRERGFGTRSIEEMHCHQYIYLIQLEIESRLNA